MGKRRNDYFNCSIINVRGIVVSFVILGCFVLLTRAADTETMRLERKNLPIKVSDQTWKIFENVQNVHPIDVKIDTTYDGGTVSKNCPAQFRLTPRHFYIDIAIYSKNITEEILAHEAMHAEYIVKGYPFFYLNRFPMRQTIANLDNSIQHIQIFKALEDMGFNSRLGDQERWREGIKMIKGSVDTIPFSAPSKVLNTFGASWTIEGLVSGIDVEEIKERIHPRLKASVDIGIKIYEELKRYDLSNKKNCFEARVKITTMLGLDSNDVTIAIMDFKHHERWHYDINTGKVIKIW